MPWEVSLVVNQIWLWVGVSYGWALVLLAVSLSMWVLKVVGVERSGSTLSAAALGNNEHSPLKRLVERGGMHAKDDLMMIWRWRGKYGRKKS